MEEVKSMETTPAAPAQSDADRMKELFEYEMTEVLAALKSEVMQINSARMQGAAKDIAIPESPVTEITPIVTEPAAVSYELPEVPDVSAVLEKRVPEAAELQLPETGQMPFAESEFQTKISLGAQTFGDAFPAKIDVPEPALRDMPELEAGVPAKPEIQLVQTARASFSAPVLTAAESAPQELNIPSVSFDGAEVSAPAMPEIALAESSAVSYAAAEVQVPENLGVTLDLQPVSVQPLPAVSTAQADLSMPELPSCEVQEVRIVPEAAEIVMPELPAYALQQVQIVPEQTAVSVPEVPSCTLQEIAVVPEQMTAALEIPEAPGQFTPAQIAVQKPDISVSVPEAAIPAGTAAFRAEKPEIQAAELPSISYTGAVCRVEEFADAELPQLQNIGTGILQTSAPEISVTVPAADRLTYEAASVEVKAGPAPVIPEPPEYDVTEIMEAFLSEKIS